MADSPNAANGPVQHVLPANLLHDLRTPLGHILGYSELLIEQMREAQHEEFIPFMEKIRSASNQMLGLINDNFTAK